MRKLRNITIGFMVGMVCLLVSLSVCAARFEGEVIKVKPEENLLILLQDNGKASVFKLAKDAKLYYNNEPANLKMYAPVTADDFVSGYLTTDESGMINKAYFFYMVREGTIEQMQNSKLVLRETESGVCDTYAFGQKTKVFVNNRLSDMQHVSSGARVLVVLDYHFQVRKLAVFQYDYMGFVEQLDLNKGTVTLNIGSRLKPERIQLQIGGKVGGVCEDWQHLALLMDKKVLVLAKVALNEESKIAYMDVRSF